MMLPLNFPVLNSLLQRIKNQFAFGFIMFFVGVSLEQFLEHCFCSDQPDVQVEALFFSVEDIVF